MGSVDQEREIENEDIENQAQENENADPSHRVDAFDRPTDARADFVGKQNDDQETTTSDIKVMARIRQVLSDERIPDPGVVTLLVVLAVNMMDGDSIAAAQVELALQARMSQRSIDTKAKEAARLGYISIDTKGAKGGVNLYRAGEIWLSSSLQNLQ